MARSKRSTLEPRSVMGIKRLYARETLGPASLQRDADEGQTHLVRRFLAPRHRLRRIVRVARIVRGVVVPRLEPQPRPGRNADRLAIEIRALPVEVPVVDVDQTIGGAVGL